MTQDYLFKGKKVFDAEIRALEKTRDSLNDTFLRILEMIVHCSGKVVVTGMGKPGHIARKISATLSSLGTPSIFLHPGEAMHGDLGMISDKDLVIVVSYSGESDEIITILPAIKLLGASVIAITGNPDSSLARTADITQVFPRFEEACHLGIAPTSSTTAALCYGDALAVTASMAYGFKKEDFGRLHPAGALGKRLILKVSDLMTTGDDNPKVLKGTLLMDAISVMSHKGLGVVSVVDNDNHLEGYLTDGDLRRMIQKRVDFYHEVVDDFMIKSPLKTSANVLAVNALSFIRKHKINNLPVVDRNNVLIGTLTWQMILRAGIVS